MCVCMSAWESENFARLSLGRPTTIPSPWLSLCSPTKLNIGSNCSCGSRKNIVHPPTTLLLYLLTLLYVLFAPSSFVNPPSTIRSSLRIPCRNPSGRTHPPTKARNSHSLLSLICHRRLCPLALLLTIPSRQAPHRALSPSCNATGLANHPRGTSTLIQRPEVHTQTLEKSFMIFLYTYSYSQAYN